jgi:hypothetical protein
MLKKLIILNKSDFLLCGGGVLGIFVLAELLTNGMALLAGEEVLMVSGMLSLFFSAVLSFFVTAANIYITFPQTVRYGATRKRAFRLTMELVGVEALLTLVLAELLTLAEQTLGMKLLRSIVGGSLEVDSLLPNWWWFPLALLLGIALGVIAGTVCLRFGRKGFWVLWVLWMLGGFFGPHLPWSQFGIAVGLISVLGAVALAALIWAVVSLLHMAIPN